MVPRSCRGWRQTLKTINTHSRSSAPTADTICRVRLCFLHEYLRAGRIRCGGTWRPNLSVSLPDLACHLSRLHHYIRGRIARRVELSIDLFPEDGRLRVHGVGEDGVTAFTEYGTEGPKQIVADERAAGKAPPPTRANLGACPRLPSSCFSDARERADFDHLSTVASTVWRMVRLSAFAVFKLIASSTFVGAFTGRTGQRHTPKNSIESNRSPTEVDRPISVAGTANVVIRGDVTHRELTNVAALPLAWRIATRPVRCGRLATESAERA